MDSGGFGSDFAGADVRRIGRFHGVFIFFWARRACTTLLLVGADVRNMNCFLSYFYALSRLFASPSWGCQGFQKHCKIHGFWYQKLPGFENFGSEKGQGSKIGP